MFPNKSGAKYNDIDYITEFQPPSVPVLYSILSHLQVIRSVKTLSLLNSGLSSKHNNPFHNGRAQSSNHLCEFSLPRHPLYHLYLTLHIQNRELSLNLITQYSMYGHITQLAEAEKAGLKKAGIDADIYQ